MQQNEGGKGGPGHGVPLHPQWSGQGSAVKNLSSDLSGCLRFSFHFHPKMIAVCAEVSW